MIVYQLKEILKDHFQIRKKPLVLQMPITSRCNSRCKTCNIWKHHDNIDMNPEALEKALKDDFFSDVLSVGLNGGEFTLMHNFIDIVRVILTLPSIHNIYLISNGLFPKRLFEYLENAKKLCNERGVQLNICISVDGFEKVHEEVRGVPNCFSKTKQILDELSQNYERYCHSFNVGCTISKYNVEYIQETEEFLSSYKNLKVEYHCAIPNKRIKTFENADYCIFENERLRLLAAEFFYKKYRTAKNTQERYQNFANYKFLTTGASHRLNQCEYKLRDVTIDENLNLMLCATASDVIGNLNEKSATELINSNETKKNLKKTREYCEQCGHYSYHPLNLRGYIEFSKEELKNRNAMRYYSICNEKNFIKKSIHRIRFYLSMVKQILKLM